MAQWLRWWVQRDSLTLKEIGEALSYAVAFFLDIYIIIIFTNSSSTFAGNSGRKSSAAPVSTSVCCIFVCPNSGALRLSVFGIFNVLVLRRTQKALSLFVSSLSFSLSFFLFFLLI